MYMATKSGRIVECDNVTFLKKSMSVRHVSDGSIHYYYLSSAKLFERLQDAIDYAQK
ncbi:hypothetical protein D3C79_286920 [compost metagenome]